MSVAVSTRSRQGIAQRATQTKTCHYHVCTYRETYEACAQPAECGVNGCCPLGCPPARCFLLFAAVY